MTPEQPSGPAGDPVKRWHVELGDNQPPRTVEAHGFRVEGGALIFVQPAGCVAAYAPGCWRTIETLDMEGDK
jgi:hypothetical protein